MKLIAPSILSADFSRLKEEIQDVEKAGADWIHVDVMDGHFVPNITIGPLIVEAVRKSTRLPIDVHLMIENPDRYIQDFVDAGADLISVHAEACIHLNRTIEYIKTAKPNKKTEESKKIKAGVALNPSTPLSSIEWVLEYLDFVLIMSVNPGFGGQNFISNSIVKIKQLKNMIKDKPILIQVDGGINKNTINEVAEAGADVFVAGSAIFKSDNYKDAIDDLKK
ncbi:MAG: ribulose-phosphate 3-epimerase [Desulfobacterales bacterium]|nr:ribulose-phosphate 3-epimerase [Desulfobacterales bacterium]